ncbi:alpha-methylacyl-CoA racemase [Schizothecium vesticola]|uniref:Alpha-methylacyl-CoA racemase n=1 Tax=Schizothecium vesticola TaxID=314040 RepID=A0AA40FB48_9PEZI|nr:alpha-methylacyl-CoA racemase [Schizothecium vesticola]
MPSPPPLTDLKVLEFAGLAPGPFAGLLLADSGASVLRIDRLPSHPAASPLPTSDQLTRHKASIAVDLKSPRGVALIRRLALAADVLIDPFRPGVLEKLSLGPSSLLPLNPRLIYARLTGFRRDGAYSTMAGHDINYLAVSGALSLLGRKHEKPYAPVNLLADFAGGGLPLVLGILLALHARTTTGRGQLVEANMVDGASYLATFPRFALKTPVGSRPRGENLLDGGCPFYDTYETAVPGEYVAVGALEPQFYAELLRGLGLEGDARFAGARQGEREGWGEMREVFERVFRTRTRGEWEAVFKGGDACVTPVLGYGELERGKGREGDQRPVVGLGETPLLAVVRGADGKRQGQGQGVEGEGYSGTALAPGDGGVKVLEEWMGWREGGDFEVGDGGVVLKDKAKL